MKPMRSGLCKGTHTARCRELGIDHMRPRAILLTAEGYCIIFDLIQHLPYTSRRYSSSQAIEVKVNLTLREP